MANKAAFLDRDGTLNSIIMRGGKPFPPTLEKEFELIPGVLEAINILKQLGYIPVVITNQPDIARGKNTIVNVDAINNKLREELQIEYVYVCPHDDDSNCNCRKPKPGLIQQASLELDIDPNISILVGDRWKDIGAGQSAGCKCFFIDNDYDEPRPRQPFIRVTSLLEVTTLIRKKSDL